MGVDGLFKGLGYESEAVQLKGGARGLRVSLHKEECHLGEGFSGVKIGHINLAALCVRAGGNGEGVLVKCI